MMRAKSRQRIRRSLLAAILDSDLSPADLRELSREFQNGSLAWELGQTLEMLASQFSNDEPHAPESPYQADKVQIALQIVKRRRISKSKLNQIVKSLDPNASLSRIEDVTVEQFLSEFFSYASARERDQLISILEAPAKDDPYLDGIMKRIR